MQVVNKDNIQRVIKQRERVFESIVGVSWKGVCKYDDNGKQITNKYMKIFITHYGVIFRIISSFILANVN